MPDHQTTAESNAGNYGQADEQIKITDWLLVLFSFLLFGANVYLWRANKRSADIAERALTELERPWIFIEAVKTRMDGSPDAPNRWFISSRLKNVGRTPAQIAGIDFKFVDIQKISVLPDYSDPNEWGAPRTLAAGEPFETREIGPDPRNARPDNTPIEYVVFGRCRYRELGGKPHASGFALRVSPQSGVAADYANDAYHYYA